MYPWPCMFDWPTKTNIFSGGEECDKDKDDPRSGSVVRSAVVPPAGSSSEEMRSAPSFAAAAATAATTAGAPRVDTSGGATQLRHNVFPKRICPASTTRRRRRRRDGIRKEGNRLIWV
mmetsp:Transcript_23465/g.52182  ORF Transcript_23465/g.52182 Transcript_23465/m.52182 type:complete len:118 (+) Transcript_23465:154-507(+)